MHIFGIAIDDNVGASIIIGAWMLSFSMLLYLIFVKLPQTKREIEETTPDLVWNALVAKLTDVKNPETQSMINGAVVFMIKSIMDDKATRLVINGKLKELATTGAKYVVNNLPEIGKAVKKEWDKGGGGQPDGLQKLAALAKIFGIDVEGIVGGLG